MSLIFKLPITTVFGDSPNGTITDQTVYGGDEPERNELALFLYLFKRDVNLVDTSVVITPNGTPITTTTWEAVLVKDGWYRARIKAVPVYNAATTINEGDIVYYDGDLFISVSETPFTNITPNVSEAEWDAFEGSLLDTEASNVIIGFYDAFHTRETDDCNNVKLTELANIVIGKGCKSLEIALPSLLFSALKDAAWAEHNEGKNVEAQDIIDYLETQCCD